MRSKLVLQLLKKLDLNRSRIFLQVLLMMSFFTTGLLNAQTVIDLAQTQADLQIIGEADDESYTGRSIAILDFNGDGYNDLAVGASGSDVPNGLIKAGKVYLFYGGPTLPNLIDLKTETADLTIYHYGWQSYMGRSLAAGDINNDGNDDLIIGTNDSKMDDVYVIYGRSGDEELPSGTLWDFGNQAADIRIKVFKSGSQPGSYIACGNIDGDDFDDILIGAPEAPFDGNAIGAMYAVFGKDSLDNYIEINPDNPEPWDLRIWRMNTGYNFGTGVLCADLNSDGIDDIVTYDPGSNHRPIQTAFLIYGRPEFKTTYLHGDYDLSINAPDAQFHWVGESIAAGDINGDDKMDLVFSLEKWLGHTYGTYVVEGPFTQNFYELDKVEADFYNPDIWIHDFGTTVACVDINADGIDDIISGFAMGSNYGHSRGEVVIVYGKNNFQPNQDIYYPSGVDIQVIGKEIYESGSDAGSQLGISVMGGDLNNDYTAEIIMGAWGDNHEGVIDVGSVYIINGNDYDNDLVLDRFDNCPETYNPDQADSEDPSDDFSLVEIDAFKWTLDSGVGTAEVENKQLKVSVPITSEIWGNGGKGIWSNGWLMSEGDFDIQVDVNSTEAINSNNDRLQAQLRLNIGVYAFTVGNIKDSDPKYQTWSNYPDFYITTSAGYSDIASYRFVRTGTTISGYYKTTGNWVLLSSTSGSEITGSARVSLNTYPADFGSENNHTVYYDNFNITSGETTYPDGIGDVCDNCVDTPNSDQADIDGDEIGDVCDDYTNQNNITVHFLNSIGEGLTGGLVQYFDGSWLTAGTTEDGVLQFQYNGSQTTLSFKMTWDGKTQQKSNQDISQPIVFQTENMLLSLINSQGNGIEGGIALYYASGWKDFGTTGPDGNTPGVELLPGNYSFKMKYVGFTQQKSNIDITITNPLIYKTLNMVVRLINSEGVGVQNGIVQYYVTDWNDFGATGPDGNTNGFELLPGTYSFKMNHLCYSEELSNIDITTINPLVFQTDISPVVTVNEPITLWPNNHKYVTVDITEMINFIDDGCCGELSTSNAVITQVTSDEPEDDIGNGDGKTKDDIIIVEGCSSVDLRAERAGGENGRVYTVTLAVSNISGNIGYSEYEIYVPHDKNDNAVKDEVRYLVEGTCEVPLLSETLGKSSESNKNIVTEIVIPTDFKLFQNYPNPFNPTTKIRYALPENLFVKLRIYDVLGNLVLDAVDGNMSAGYYEFTFDASELSSGLYLYRIETEKFVDTKKMILLR